VVRVESMMLLPSRGVLRTYAHRTLSIAITLSPSDGMHEQAATNALGVKDGA